MIKQAYINGFMRKCAQHGVDGRKLLRRVMTKRAWADDLQYHAEDAAGQLAYQNGMHTPIDWSAYGTNLVNRVDPKAEWKNNWTPERQGVIDMATQLGIDSLPDAPGVRNPTPYELYQFINNLGDVAWQSQHPDNATYIGGKGVPPVKAQPDAINNIQSRPGLEASIFASPALQNEYYRRLWNYSTNQVPIQATSPTR